MSDEDLDPEFPVPDDWEPDEDTLAELEYSRNAPDEDDIDWLLSQAPDYIRDPPDNPGVVRAEQSAEDVPRSKSAERREEQLLDARDAAVKRMQDDNGRRQVLFWFIVGAAAVPVVMSSAVMGWLTITGRETELMVAAFFGSVVVQVIGLAVIVTKNLFPENGDNGQLPG